MKTAAASTEAALSNDHVPYLVLVELDFAEGMVRLTNAGHDFVWNGYTWTGAGNLGSISAIEEGMDLQMYGCTLTLSGIASEYIVAALGTTYSGRNATIYLAALTDRYKMIGDPIIIFKGIMDTMPVRLGSDAAIQLTIESRLTDWERPRNRRYNHEDQQSEYTDDKGFEFVAQMVEKEIFWGRPYA